MSDLYLCGLALDEVGELNKVFAKEYFGGTEILYFGVGDAIRVIGFSDVKIEPITYWYSEGEGNNAKFKVSEEYTQMQEFLETQVRGRCQIVIKIEDGFIFAEDLDWDSVVRQPTRLGSAPTVRYNGIQDISSVDEDEYEYMQLVNAVASY